MKAREMKTPMGPLSVHPDNPRYFADAEGNPVYLTGSHTWNNLKDYGATDPPKPFDWDAYLHGLAELGHNLIRLWHWEQTRCDFGPWTEGDVFWDPFPWERTGPPKALDGKPKFDLTRFNNAFFDRLRTRAESAAARGVYVDVMLFEGWGLQYGREPWCWDAHPFHRDNNMNGLDGNPGRDGRNLRTHTLDLPEVTRAQEAYIRKVIDTLNDLDNVLYEVANVSVASPDATAWQYHMINFIKQCESEMPKQHPVGMTFPYASGSYRYEDGSNDALFQSPADWISPGPEGGYRHAPPAADGSKVIICDSDHLWGIGGTRHWVWKCLTRGMNPIYMDPWDKCDAWKLDENDAVDMRRSMGCSRAFANRIDLAKMTPRQDLASSAYCLASPVADGAEYLVYLPDGGSVTVDLTAAAGSLSVEWFNPETGEMTRADKTEAGANRAFTAPFKTDAVLYLF